MLTKIKMIVLAITHLLVAVIVFMGFYYLKYRPTRNANERLTATNVELRKQCKTKDIIINSVWEKYYQLAGMPRYQIDNHLDRIKVKRGSKLEFVPSSLMMIQDSLKLKEGDSIILQNRTILPLNDQRHWWQFWKERQPP